MLDKPTDDDLCASYLREFEEMQSITVYDVVPEAGRTTPTQQGKEAHDAKS